MSAPDQAAVVTKATLSAHARSGICWRPVEAQHQVSTLRLLDSVAEQELLEGAKRSCTGLALDLTHPPACTTDPVQPLEALAQRDELRPVGEERRYVATPPTWKPDTHALTLKAHSYCRPAGISLRSAHDRKTRRQKPH
jgi:hypothetical protein